MTKNTQPEVKTGSNPKRKRGCGCYCAIFFAFSTFLLALILTVMLVLPSAVETQINKVLAGMSQNGAMNLNVKYIGLFRTDLSFRMTAGGTERSNSVFLVESCTIQYNPFELIRGHIRNIDVNGVNVLVAVERNGEWEFPILKVLKKAEKKALNTNTDVFNPETWKESIPMTLDALSVSGNLMALMNDDLISLPFYSDFKPDNGLSWDRTQCSGNIYLSTNRLSFKGRCDIPDHTLSGGIDLRFSTDALPYSIREKLPRDLSAAMRLQADGVYNFQTRSLDALSGDGTGNAAFRMKELTLRCNPSFTLRGDKEHILLSVLGLDAAFKERAFNLPELRLRFDRIKKELNGFILYGLGEKPDFRAELTARLEDRKRILFEVRSGEKPETAELSAVLNGLKTNFDSPEFFLNGSYEDQTLLYNLDATLPRLEGINPSFAGTLQNLNLKLSGKNAGFQYCVKTGPVSVTEPSCHANYSTPGITAEGDFTGDALFLRLSGKNNRIDMKKFQLEAADIVFDLPLHWPSPEKNAPSGTIKIGVLRYSGKDAGTVNASLIFENNRFGMVGNGSVLGLNPEFAADIRPFEPGGFVLRSSLNVPEQEFHNTPELKALFPQLENAELKAKVLFAANYDVTPLKSGGSAALKLSDGELVMKENDLSVSDIRFTFNLPELPNLESKANQLFSFKNFHFGAINVDSMRTRFRMESPTVWYLESLQSNWCGGKVRVESTRFSPENKRLRLTLHCDRVRLGALLEQFGVGKDSGYGNVSGTIPMIISKDDIRFNDGFLYSTPGEEGQIKLIPGKNLEDAAEASVQMGLAMDALNDFTYSWSRVTMESENGQMRLKLQVDGRPNHPLNYEMKDGNFIKANVPHLFQGIRLDVNLSLPLSDTMRLVKTANNLFEKQQ